MSKSPCSQRALPGAAVLLAACLAGSAFGQQPAKPVAASASAPSGAEGSPEQLFGLWDVDKNGQLSRKEFTEGWEQARDSSMLSRLEAQFKGMDADRNGVLDEKEYASLPMIKRAGPGAPRLAVFDIDKSGKLDFREYLGMIQTMIRRSESGTR